MRIILAVVSKSTLLTLAESSSTLTVVQDVHEGWGEAVLERLAELGRTQSWLARAVDRDKSTINRVVKGDLCPTDELKWLIAGALEIRMDRLWEWPRVVPPFPGDDDEKRGAA